MASLTGKLAGKMKVLAADKLEKSALSGIAALGLEVLSEPDLSDETLRARLAESRAEILIVRSTKVTADMIAGSNLKVIIRAGAGYNTIDVAAASNHGTYVSNCPGKNAQAVAELAMGLLLSLDRSIPDNVASLRAGTWNKKGFGKARGLYGRTLGLVGLGHIGREMAARAKAFGMRVIAHSGHTSPEEAAKLGISLVSLKDLAAQADAVSVHCSLSERTRGLLGAEFFEALKPGTLFVNTSRSEVVDQNELIRAVREKGIKAGIDVFDGEPAGGEGEYDGVLRSEKIYVTHHIGASTDQAQEAVADETVRIVREFVTNGNVPNAVNRP